MDFEELNERILPLDEKAMEQTKRRLDAIAKPLDGLGELEKICIRIAGLTGQAELSLKKRAVVVFCADNGVVAEGVTQTDASVTAVMARRIALGQSCVCRMAETAGAKVLPVDIGMLRRVEGVRDLHIADGTGNIAAGPAMTRGQALEALERGMALAGELKEKGYELCACGEMGIGNTTTSGAVASVLLSLPPEQTVGPGAGLSAQALERKRDIVRQAIELNRPDPFDALDVLCKLGGFDIAGMTGFYLGCALHRLPVLLDGLIGSVAALLAVRLCPGSRIAMIPSHSSAEPAAKAIMETLGFHPILWGNFKLGEGTGAVCMMPLLDMVLSVYRSAVSFSEVDIPQYRYDGRKAETADRRGLC